MNRVFWLILVGTVCHAAEYHSYGMNSVLQHAASPWLQMWFDKHDFGQLWKEIQLLDGKRRYSYPASKELNEQLNESKGTFARYIKTLRDALEQVKENRWDDLEMTPEGPRWKPEDPRKQHERDKDIAVLHTLWFTVAPAEMIYNKQHVEHHNPEYVQKLKRVQAALAIIGKDTTAINALIAKQDVSGELVVRGCLK